MRGIFGREKGPSIYEKKMEEPVRKSVEEVIEEARENLDPDKSAKKTGIELLEAKAKYTLQEPIIKWYQGPEMKGLKWLHKRELEKEGFNPETKNVNEMIEAWGKLGGPELLEKSRKYRGVKNELEGLHGSIEKLKKAKEGEEKRLLSIGEEYLALNQLDKIDEKLIKKIATEKVNEEVKGKGLPDEEIEQKIGNEINNVRKDVFETKKEFGEKISGRNLEKEASEKGEKNYIDTTFSQMFGDFQKQDYKDYLEAAGYRVVEERANFPDPRSPGRLKNVAIKMHVEDPSNNPILHLHTGEELKEEDLIEKLKEITLEKVEPEFKKEWEVLEPADKDKVIKDLIEREIKTIAETPEKAKGGIAGFYGGLKKEWVKEEQKKKREEITEKEDEKVKKIEELGEKLGIIDVPTFLEEAGERKDKTLKKTIGDVDKDYKHYKGYFKDNFGYDLDRGIYDEFNKKMEELGVPYSKKIVETPSLFTRWWINFLRFLLGREVGIEQKLESFQVE